MNSGNIKCCLLWLFVGVFISPTNSAANQEAEYTSLVKSFINKQKAQSEADKLMTGAREDIQNDKMKAISELKNQVGQLAIEIAEKVVKGARSGCPFSSSGKL